MDPKTYGLLFESLAVRDMRVYTQPLGGDLRHYRDEDNLEVDMVSRLRDGRWGALEARLGAVQIEQAAKNLKKLAAKVDAEAMNPPSFLAVVTCTDYAYTREDGVHMIPLGCLRE